MHWFTPVPQPFLLHWFYPASKYLCLRWSHLASTTPHLSWLRSVYESPCLMPSCSASKSPCLCWSSLAFNSPHLCPSRAASKSPDLHQSLQTPCVLFLAGPAQLSSLMISVGPSRLQVSSSPLVLCSFQDSWSPPVPPGFQVSSSPLFLPSHTLPSSINHSCSSVSALVCRSPDSTSAHRLGGSTLDPRPPLSPPGMSTGLCLNQSLLYLRQGLPGLRLQPAPPQLSGSTSGACHCGSALSSWSSGVARSLCPSGFAGCPPLPAFPLLVGPHPGSSLHRFQWCSTDLLLALIGVIPWTLPPSTPPLTLPPAPSMGRYFCLALLPTPRVLATLPPICFCLRYQELPQGYKWGFGFSLFFIVFLC